MMRNLLYVFSLLGFLFLSACSEAIPVVTNLSSEEQPATPSAVDDSSPSVNSGGGELSGGSYKIFGKVGPSASVLVGSQYRINMNGDN